MTELKKTTPNKVEYHHLVDPKAFKDPTALGVACKTTKGEKGILYDVTESHDATTQIVCGIPPRKVERAR
jgi:hypothetical protein